MHFFLKIDHVYQAPFYCKISKVTAIIYDGSYFRKTPYLINKHYKHGAEDIKGAQSFFWYISKW